MMAEYAIGVDQWVIKPAPVFEKTFRKHRAAGRRFFDKAIVQNGAPETITIDQG